MNNKYIFLFGPTLFRERMLLDFLRQFTYDFNVARGEEGKQGVTFRTSRPLILFRCVIVLVVMVMQLIILF